MGEEIARTKRLILRTLERSDWNDYWTHLNTAEVRAKLNGIEERPDFERKLMENENWQREKGYSFWAVDNRQTGQFLGHCGFKPVDDMPSAYTGSMEIGWAFRADCWGTGIGTEAARAALDTGFRRFEPEQVISLTDRSNTGSWRIMEKIGMKHHPEHDFHDPDFPPELNPTIVYVIDQAQWRNQP